MEASELSEMSFIVQLGFGSSSRDAEVLAALRLSFIRCFPREPTKIIKLS